MVTTFVLSLICWLHQAPPAAAKATPKNKLEQRATKQKQVKLAKQKGSKKYRKNFKESPTNAPEEANTELTSTPKPAEQNLVSQPSPTPTRAGQVIALRGNALVQRVGDARQESIAKGTALYQGDTIMTKENSTLRILMGDNSVLDLAGNSTLALQQFAIEPSSQDRAINIQMVLGKLWARIAPRIGLGQTFNIVMPNAVAGIRGTSLVVDVANSDQSTVSVVHGSVDLQDQSGTHTMLGAMEQTSLQGDLLMPIIAVDSEKISQLAQQLSPTPNFDSANASGRLDVHQQMQTNQPQVESSSVATTGATGSNPAADPINEQNATLSAPVLNLDPALSKGEIQFNIHIED